MKKKLVLLILLIGSIFGVFACKTVPYKNMKISTPEVYGYYEKSPSGDSEEFYEISNVNSFEKSQNQTLGWKALDDIVNLEITDEGNGDYSYDIKTVRVRVSDTNKKTDLGISLTGGDGFVSTNIKYLGDGITSITIKPISPQKTGKFTLCATTNEGNKTCYINVNIDLKLNYFEFKQDALKAIANGGEIDLQNVDDFINFYPTNTTQKDIKFDVVYPKDDSLDVDGNKFIYDIDLNNVKYGKYAEIIDNNILKTYKYYNNDKSQNMDYPIWDSTSNVGTNTTTGVKKIKISATFISKSGIQIYQTHLIEVVDECTDYKVMMNRQTPDLYASGEVALSSYKKDGINIYEVVLLDPNFRESMLGVDDPYYIRRQLRFDLNPQVDDAGNKSDYRVEDYQVVTNTVLETDNQPVVISNVALNSDYIIQAQSAGTYLHKFTIQNIKYPGLFDRDIYVQFIVKTVPTKITINDKEIVLNTLNDHVYTVYDYYPSWSYGTRFKVQINSEFKYFVYFDGEYDSDVFSNVKLYKNNGTLQKFGVLSSDGAGIVSADGSENYSRFSNESFYLRHELPMLPDREFNLYIGINFDMKADSYTDDVSDAFTTSLLSFPFKIKFENGIRNIAFTQKEYHVDLTNSKFVVRGDENTEEGIDFIRDGIKLFELPVGQTDETAIDSITYNEELVWVGSFTDAESNITTFYLKANNNFIVDKTTIRVTAYNGVSNSVTVHTYIPTVYANNIGKAPEAEMPLSVYVNKYSSGYLYHLATSVFNSEGGILDREELIEKNNSYSFDLTDNEGIDCGLYNSVGTLFMITNAQQEIRFYDYRLWYDYDYSGRKLAGHYEEIDITDKVKVSFNFGNYVSYKNGILKTYNFYSDFASSPIIMTIKYVGAYDLFDEDGNPIYTLYEVEHVIYLYVYKPLEGVEITSSKQVELYMRDTLSYYDLALSEGMIVSTFIPDQYDLGAEWNQILAIPSSTIYAITFEDGTIQNIAMYSVGDESEPYVEEDYWYINDKRTEYKANGSISIHGNAISVEKIGSNGTAGSKGVPVELLYDYNATLDNFIMKDDGTQLIIYPFNGNEDDAYQLRYRDLFEVEWNEINYTCNVVARLSKELVGDPANGLNGWLNDNYNGRVDDFLKTIFTSDITLTIYVSIRQFGKLQNINSVNFTASYANKIGGLRIDVDSDGVYFEVRNGYSTPESVALNYTIDTAEVANRNIRLYNAHTASYQADVRINSVGNGGSVTIIPTTTAGVEYLIIVPEDNIKNVDSLGNIEYYDRSLVKTVRIKVADGSEEYPFEIRNVSEYSQMLKDIDNEEMYHYIITRDIDLSLLNREFSAGNAIKNIPYGTGIGAFSLSGRLDYYNTDGILSSKYSSLYNLNIKVIAAINDGSIGLFGNIGSNVTIKYLGIANATIRIIAPFNFEKDLCVGILAGCSNGSVIIGCKMSGSISISGAGSFTTHYIGGMIGKAESTTIKCLPGDYEDGVVSTGNNINCEINISSPLKSVYAGGLVGYADKTYIGNERDSSQGLQIISKITTLNTTDSKIGGVVGCLNDGYIYDTVVYPTMSVNNSGATFEENKIGGIAGELCNSILSSSIIYFVNIGNEYYWDQKANIILNSSGALITKFGGLVGETDSNSTVEYSYVRSFYNEDIPSNTLNHDAYGYAGNIVASIMNSGSKVGGIVGNNKGTIRSSYFNADISSNAITGMLAAKSDGTILDSYAIGQLYVVTSCTGSNIDLAIVEAKVQNQGVIGNIIFDEDSAANNGVTKSYAVINKKDYYILDDGAITYYVATDPNTADTKIWFKNLGFAITDGSGTGSYAYTGAEKWFINDNANKVLYMNTPKAFPIVLKGTKALYDLIPTGMSAQINESASLYDLTYDGVVQVLMYLNSDSVGNQVNDLYEISVNKVNPSIKIKLNGTTIVTEYITIDLNDSIEISEDSEGSVIMLSGSRIIPKNTGVATITVRSYLDKTIKCEIIVQVVRGINDYKITSSDNRVLQYIDINNSDPADTIWIDETSYYSLATINKIAGFNYLPNQNVGYIVEILDVTETDPDAVNATIKLNNKNYYVFDEVDYANNIFKLNVNNITASGCTLGQIKLKITPYAVLDQYINYEDTYYDAYGNEVNYQGIKILNWLQHTYLFLSASRAMSIDTNVPSIELTTRNTNRLTVTIETSNLVFTQIGANSYIISLTQIGEAAYEGVQFLNEKFTFRGLVATKVGEIYYIDERDNTTGNYFEYELLDIAFKGISIVKTNTNVETRLNTYKVTFTIDISFDKEYYRMHADKFDLNTAGYMLEFVPSSNRMLSTQCQVSIRPAELTGIFANYYSRGEKLLGTDEYYMQELEGNYIVPGRTGILKLTLGEEFNNSSYVTITTSNDNANYLTMTQLYGIVGYSSGGAIDKIDQGEVREYGIYENSTRLNYPGSYGLQLSKMSINYLDKNYFNNTYYIQIDLTRDYGNLTSITFSVQSYIKGQNGINTPQFRDNQNQSKPLKFTYNIAEIPVLRATINGDDYVDMSVGTSNVINFTHKGVNSDINYNIGFNTVDPAEVADYVYIVDDEGNYTYNTLSIDYIKSGRKYYLMLDIATIYKNTNEFDWKRLGKLITINFNVIEYVYGRLEEAFCKLEVNPVQFEIEYVTLCGANDGQLTMLHGQSKNVTTKIHYKDITIGNSTLVDKYNKYLNTYYGNSSSTLGVIETLEYALAGTTVKQPDESVLVSGGSYLKGFINEDNYSLLIGGVFNGIRLSEDRRIISGKSGASLQFDYKYIKGIVLSSNTIIRLESYYHYDENGNVVIGFGDELINYSITTDVRIIVKDNSTYDHPVPIEDANDLLRYSTSDGGNFILLNDIELVDWIPQDATFDSLDGNGYVITIKSFNFSNIGSDKEVNAGIFKTTAENTLLKNIIVDVSPMLINSVTMLNNISLSGNNSASTSYPDNTINLNSISKLNFGILVGSNAGAITNARIINTHQSDNSETDNYYFHVVSTQGYLDNNLVNTNIGGIAGVNTTTGAITNSYVGLNISTTEDSSATIKRVKVNNTLPYSNANDKENGAAGADILVDAKTYPFVLAGGNNLAGIVAVNNGIISNTYNKGMGLYNTFPYSEDAKTGGLTAINNGKITSCFVEGSEIENYRAIDNVFRIEAIGTIGGLVHTNNGVVENAYSNAFLETQSTFIGGFVYSNTGYIHNAYSTAVNRNSLATGQFTGVKRSVLQNTGTYENCYYLVDDSTNELSNKDEDAIAIFGKMNVGNNEQSVFDATNTWNGFAFTNNANSDAIWTIGQGRTPYIATTFIDTISFRLLTDVETSEVVENTENSDTADNPNVIIQNPTVSLYSYDYNTNELGSKFNPLIIETAKHFMTYIINESEDRNNIKVFGLLENLGSELQQSTSVGYVRIVNNLDFSQIITSNSVGQDDTYLYETVFAGNLDGNGMTFKSLNINTDTTNLRNFGLFGQIGLPTSKSAENEKIYGMNLPVSGQQALIKNLILDVNSYKSNSNNRAGILAGTIVNSKVVNVEINGNGNRVSGLNMAGALAGLIYADEGGSVSIFDVTVHDVEIEATYGSLGGAITAFTGLDNPFYNKFSVTSTITGNVVANQSFVSLYNDTTDKTELVISNQDNTPNVSYAGAVAGVILANNYKKELATDDSSTEGYRTEPDSNTIDNIVVKGNIVISTADNAGGLFGYVGEKTLIKNSKFVLQDSGQLLKAYNNIGGIVGENHGVIEECSVAYEKSVQEDLDNQILEANSNRTGGTTSLFDSTTGTSYYVVSIGGIAGYSSHGVIIDCMSKVNVVKPLTFIAGGLVGYAYRYNYIGYSYTTGAVYGKNVTGGIVGLSIIVNEDQLDTKDGLNMEKVFGLNNWNLTTNDFDYRNAITKSLYDNQKIIYISEGESVEVSYDNFYIKMPEMGNDISYEMPTAVDNPNLNFDNPEDPNYVHPDDEHYDEKYQQYVEYQNYLKLVAKIKSYNTNHDSIYIGSVIGEYLIVKENYLDNNYHITGTMLTTTEENFIYGSSGVISTTLGFMTSDGQIEAYTRVDNYDESTFTLDTGDENGVDLYSYRVAYREEDGLNYKEANYDDTTKYLDRLSFAKRFTSQEYAEQILGGYYFIDPNGMNTNTTNLFKNHYYKDRGRGGSLDECDTRFGESSQGVNKVWSTTRTLPIYSRDVYEDIKTIIDEDTLKQALNNTTDSKLYYVEPSSDNKIVYNVDNSDSSVRFNNIIEARFIGILKENTKPTIEIKVDSSCKFATLFNMFNGAVFENIKFVINFNQSTVNMLAKSKFSNDYGLFVNSLYNATINNCEFEIEFANPVIFNSTSENYYSTSVGLLFGGMYNSVISDSSFTITLPSGITINNALISSAGMFAGSAINTNIKNTTFDIINNNEITITKSANTLNAGGLIGYARALRLTDITLSAAFNVNVSDNFVVAGDKHIGGLIGYAENSNILNIHTDTDLDIAMTYNGSGSDNSDINILNMACIVGTSKGSTLDKICLHKDNGFNIQDTRTIKNASIGAIVGCDISNTTMGTGDTACIGSDMNIEVQLKSNYLSVGGLIGTANKSNRLLYNAYNNGKIVVENQLEGKIASHNPETARVDVYNYIGGLIGYVKTSMNAENVFNAGDIYIIYTTDNVNSHIYSGGLIGYSTGFTSFNNFASIGDILLDKGDNSSDYNNTVAYFGGVIGNNFGTLTGLYGYSYTEFKKKSSSGSSVYTRYPFTHTVTSAIANGAVSASSKQVYYAQEFVGNNYDNGDYKFETFAIGDLYYDGSYYKNISEYSAIYKLIDPNEYILQQLLPPLDRILAVANSNVLILLPRTIITQYVQKPNTENSKFKVNVGVSDSTIYNVIVEDNKTVGINELKENCIISGRALDHHKTVIQGASGDGYIINEILNNAVVSNLYIYNYKDESQQYHSTSLCYENNGLITHCYVYGISKSNSVLAMTNKGNIYASATAVQWIPESISASTTMYGLVETNCGKISDCYSRSFPFIQNTSGHKIDVYMVGNNGILSDPSDEENDIKGIIQYSYYHVLKEMLECVNDVNDVDESTKNSKTISVEDKEIASFVKNRQGIWMDEIENGHSQLRGFTDTHNGQLSNGMFVGIKLKLKGDTEYTDYSTGGKLVDNIIEDVSTKKGLADGLNGIYSVGYELISYVDDESKPGYNVVLITNGNSYVSYFNSLVGNTLPTNTIVLIVGKITIEVNYAQKLHAFSIPASSAIIGVGVVRDSSEIDPEISFSGAQIQHEIVYQNRGMILNVCYSNFTIIGDTSKSGLAPIMNNQGILANVKLHTYKITNNNYDGMSGFVYDNSEKGYMYDCQISGYALEGGMMGYVNYICYFNYNAEMPVSELEKFISDGTYSGTQFMDEHGI